jgi:hypothetical protein
MTLFFLSEPKSIWWALNYSLWMFNFFFCWFLSKIENTRLPIILDGKKKFVRKKGQQFDKVNCILVHVCCGVWVSFDEKALGDRPQPTPPSGLKKYDNYTHIP